MSREIKFRVYDKDNKTISQNGSVYNWWLDDKKRYELMQFTGLLDKNGKEIYEGDVIVYPDTYSDYVDVGVGGYGVKVAETEENSFAEVLFQEGTFGLLCPKGSETLGKGFHSFWWIVNEYGFELSELEVIGNIYENPDILERGDKE